MCSGISSLRRQHYYCYYHCYLDMQSLLEKIKTLVQEDVEETRSKQVTSADFLFHTVMLLDVEN